MYSGLALLKDVHYPAATNGYDIIFVPGTGFHPPLAYDAPPLKATPAVPLADQPEDSRSICWVFRMEWVTPEAISANWNHEWRRGVQLCSRSRWG